MFMYRYNKLLSNSSFESSGFLLSGRCDKRCKYANINVGDGVTSRRTKDVFSSLSSRFSTTSSIPEVVGTASERPPTEAKLVICGGGVVGASVAYHVTKSGGALWKDIVLLEQGRLGGGSTWLSSGLLGQLRNSAVETELCQYSTDLYKKLHSEGKETGWKTTGSLLLARTKDRMTQFRRLKSFSNCRQLDCDLLPSVEAERLCPIIRVDDVEGALWIPSDGTVDTYVLCQTLLKEAVNGGAQIYEQCAVKRVLVKSNRVVAVETNKGSINCEYFVNCAGLWARNVGQMSKPEVKVPLHPCEHYYLHTKPIDGLDLKMPVVRDYDGYIYLREKNNCIIAGGFEPVAKPTMHEKASFESQATNVKEDWDHFHVLLMQLLHRVPTLRNAQPERLYNGPECFSPDGKWIVGKSPELRNYFVASGTKANGASAAGGLGWIISNWLINGNPPLDICEIDIKRFIGLHNNRKFLKDRIKEVPGLHYKINYPFFEFEHGRKLRMSPIYPRLKAMGAVFSQTMGYERPAWFENPKSSGDRNPVFRIAKTDTFGKPSWFDNVHVEYKACRDGVALLDYSSFSKLELGSKGREVVDFLQYLCSNDVDIPVGTITHTGLQNRRGGYENDCSLARLAENRYMMIAPTIQQSRCYAWLQQQMPSGGKITTTDVTSLYTAICVMGANSRHLLAELTDSDMSTTNFPFFTFKELDVGLASRIKVMNLTHTGEVGWILYIPNEVVDCQEFALHVYDLLVSVGAMYDLRHAGAFAMRTLRIEKFYAFWGQDLDTTTTPLECGRGFRVKFNKGDFIGREALLNQQREGVKRKYVQLVLEDHDLESDPWPWGQEPIFRDGVYVGVTTTTCYGYTLEKQVCLGFVQSFDANHRPQVITNDFVLKGNYEVEIAGRRFAVKANLRSPKLPSGDMEMTSQERYIATQAS